jgi:hypothetical protein
MHGFKIATPLSISNLHDCKAVAMTSAQASMDTIEASDEHLALTCSLLYTSRAVQEATRVSRQQR